VIPRADGTGGATLQASGITIDDSDDISSPGGASFGVGSGVSGAVTFTGATSGSATIGAADVAGTPTNINLPTATGVAGTFLKTDGGTPQQTSFATAVPTLHTFRPQHAELPASNFATLDTRNNHPVLNFDAATEETVYFSDVMNRGYLGGAVQVMVHYAMASATTAEVIWCAAFERIGDGQLDIDADSFDTAVCSAATTVPGTTGHVDIVTLSFANQAAIDDIAVGEAFRLKVYRDADDAGDDATGDAQLRMVEVKQ
jgi:hypothetical protein